MSEDLPAKSVIESADDDVLETTDVAAADKASGGNTLIPKPVAIVAVLIIAIAFCYWLYQRATHVYSDDARISADMIDISSKVSGWIVEFPVSSGDKLNPGDVIASIDSREIRLKLKELEADLSALASQYQATQAEIVMVEQQTDGGLQVANSQLTAAQSLLASSDSELAFRTKEWERAQTLRKKKIIAQQGYESAQTFYQKAQQARQTALASVAIAQAKKVEASAAQSRLAVLERGLARQRYQRESLEAQIERQRIDLQDRHMISPQTGTIDKVFVDSGEYVQPGRRLLLMHDPNKVWVNANIKETQIRHIAVGQAVAIKVDAYPDIKFSGVVEKIGHAVTSQFALLPNTNPSGNFTKVTQRLTIKVAIDQHDSQLRPGMMVEVAIKTG